MKYEIDNFTAVLPITCNADCSFCPEKESEKISKEQYIENLVKAINETQNLGYDHISISGGEPTLDPRLLKEVIRAILSRTSITKIGLTTNGQFLESEQKLAAFLDAISDANDNCLLDFINISRHAISNDDNNEIMKVNYKHTWADIVAFRQILPIGCSFHINMVQSENSDYTKVFKGIKTLNPVLKDSMIDVVFRTDYAWKSKLESDELIPPELYFLYTQIFGNCMIVGECPTCITYKNTTDEYDNIYLKGANYEPTNNENTIREFIFHMNGELYLDWQRNKPYTKLEPSIEELLGEVTLKSITLRDRKPKHNIVTVDVSANNESIYNRCGFGPSIRCGY